MSDREKLERIDQFMVEEILSEDLATEAAEAIRRAFILQGSGCGRYWIELKYGSMAEMHDAYDAIIAWAKSVLEPDPAKATTP
jgi:hypothetical protein